MNKQIHIEIWKSLKGIVLNGDNYAVSTTGMVKNVKKDKLVKEQVSERGYGVVYLSKGGKHKKYKVHRLVMLAFVPNPEALPEVNHLNGIKLDNRIENLEWSSSKDNVKHAFEIGLTGYGEDSGNAKLTEEDVYYIRKNYSKGDSHFGGTGLARLFGVQASAIYHIVHGRTWKHLLVDGDK